MSRSTPTRCAVWATYSGCGVLAATLLLSYGIWVSDGCLPFLPFVSDLGLKGHMRLMFIAGLELSAVLFAVALPPIFLARRCLLNAHKAEEAWQKANVFITGCAVAVIGGVAALGFLPWDRIFWPHLLCAAIIFDSGFFWMFGSAALCHRLRSGSPRLFWGAGRRMRSVQLGLVPATACVGLLALVSLVGALTDDPRMFSEKILPSMVHIAVRDFNEYCVGREGWHLEPWINWLALSEWLYVACLILAVLSSSADLESYAAFSSSSASDPLLHA